MEKCLLSRCEVFQLEIILQVELVLFVAGRRGEPGEEGELVVHTPLHHGRLEGAIEERGFSDELSASQDVAYELLKVKRTYCVVFILLEGHLEFLVLVGGNGESWRGALHYCLRLPEQLGQVVVAWAHAVLQHRYHFLSELLRNTHFWALRLVPARLLLLLQRFGVLEGFG